MWPIPSKTAYSQALLRFLWRQWGQLGVAGRVDRRDGWIIDPEPLLLFTLQVARRDPRLFDEVIDWAVINSRRLMIQRCKSVLGAWSSPELAELFSALARVLNRREKSGRWRSLANRERRVQGSANPFSAVQSLDFSNCSEI